jgi:hypothetical protein
MDRPIAILYEHPEWFKPLFAELARRDVSSDALDLAQHTFDPGAANLPYALVVNRMSPSAHTRGHRNAIFHTLHYLAYLEDLGVPTVNGTRPSSSSSRRPCSARSSLASACRIRAPA